MIKFQKVLEKYALMMLSYALNWKDLERIPMMQDSAYHISILKRFTYIWKTAFAK